MLGEESKAPVEVDIVGDDIDAAENAMESVAGTFSDLWNKLEDSKEKDDAATHLINGPVSDHCIKSYLCSTRLYQCEEAEGEARLIRAPLNRCANT